jgi:hypothetical protein
MTGIRDPEVIAEWARRRAREARFMRRYAVVAVLVAALLTWPAWRAHASAWDLFLVFAIAAVCQLAIWLTLSRYTLTCPHCGQRPAHPLALFQTSHARIATCHHCRHQLTDEVR